MYDIIIIGGGPAGLSAAIYAARAGRRTLVLEGAVIGGQIATSPRVENYPGIKKISGMELADNLYEQAKSLGVDIELESAVKIIDNGKVKTVVTDSQPRECGAVIIAAGVKHRKLEVPREDDLLGRGVSYCAVCDGAFFKGKTVAVVGGGSSALTAAELLSDGCAKVYLIHRREEFRGEASLLALLEGRDKVEILRSTVIKELRGEQKLSGAIIENRVSGEVRELPLDGLFVSVGQIPENDRFADVIDLDESGYAIAGEDTKTNRAGIFAAGDCRTKTVRQLTTAAADGAVAALGACEYLRN